MDTKLSDSSTQQKPVRQRQGTTSSGNKYEAHLAALYAIKCVLDNNITDFTIASNLDGYGDFDDIILDVTHDDNSRTKYLLQLKHRENKAISLQQLLSPVGDFSLKKYQASYDKIINNFDENRTIENCSLTDFKVMLLTNAKFNQKIDSKPSIQVTELPSSKETFLNTLDKSRVWKIKDLSNKDSPSYNPDFLEHLYLFTEQVHANDIENMITDLLEIQNNNVTKLILNFFEIWADGKKVRHYELSARDVEMKLTEIILGMYKIPLADEIANNTQAYELWNEVTMDYDLMFMPAGENHRVKDAITWKVQNGEMWTKKMDKTLLQDFKYCQLIRRRKAEHCSVEQISLDDVYLSMWEQCEVPLIIDCSEERKFENAKSVLSKFAAVRRKFIIFTDHASSADFGQYKVFHNLASLAANKMPHVLRRLQLSLQERNPTTHQQFSPDNRTLLELITPDLFAKLAFCEVNIGAAISTSDYIVKRHFRKIIVFIDILEVTSEYCKIIMKNEDKEVFSQLLNIHYITQPPQNLIITVEETSPSEVRKVITEFTEQEGNKRSSTHFFIWGQDFQWEGIPVLEWVYSNVNSKLVSQFLLSIVKYTPDTKQFFLEASKALDHYHMPLMFFCNNSGMGKTVTLRHMAKNCPPHIWVVYIDCSTKPTSLKHLTDENVDITSILKSFLGMSKIQGNAKEFFCAIFKRKLLDGEVLFLIDSYDVAENQADQLLQFLKKENNKIWVSSRSCIKQNLEYKFETVSLQLIGFNRNQAQDVFDAIMSGKRYHWDSKETENVLKHLTDDLIAIPLHIKMLAKITRNVGREILTEKITTMDLYEKFINTIDKQSFFIIRKLALTLFFKEDDLKGIIEWDEFEINRDEMMKNNQRNFILDGFSGNRPHFLHHSYAEYLAATYLASAVERMRRNKEAFRILLKQLFHLKNLNIRIFLDKLLSKTLPLHEAIVDDDMERVTTLLEQNNAETLLHVDEYGRTPLHLASSYGKFFFFLDDSLLEKLMYFSKLEDVNILISEVPNSRHHGEDIFSAILEAYNKRNIEIAQNQDILGFNIFDLAHQCGCLNILNKQLHVYVSETPTYSENVIHIYHCIRNGLNNILEKMIFDCFCHVKCNGENLINTTVKHCNVSVIEIVLNKAYNCKRRATQTTLGNIIKEYELLNSACERHDDLMESVISFLLEKVDSKFWESNKARSPLHVAADKDNARCIELLLSKGAELNVTDHKGMTALHVACAKSNLRCVEELLKHKIKIDAQDLAGNMALHLAVMSLNSSCVRTLLDHGAEVETANENGLTPLMLATISGEIECVTDLIKHGAIVNKSNMKRQIALHHSIGIKISVTLDGAQNKLVKIIQILIDSGANIDDVDKDDNSVLMLAIKHNKFQVADVLMERGASVHAANKHGSTALTFAIIAEKAAYVRTLLEKNASPNGCDELGNTNLMLAMQSRNNSIINDLLEHEDIDVCGTTKDGLTALILGHQCGLEHLILMKKVNKQYYVVN